ncbi:MAG: hypothetical protein GEU74_01575 [Nitriliruptorales bacterium]|nr:hypothetical protein [Nitriliruptorales bacterium]
MVTRTRKFISYDFAGSGGGELRYVFDPQRDHCDSGSAVMTCYGPRPPRPDRPARRRPAPPPPPVTPQEIVERTIVNVRLPNPRPNIDPGYAITGMRAYLETGNRSTHRFNPIATVLGPLSITARSTYIVDWGDATITGPHATTGGKYPDGTITHVYQDSQLLDVVVTQHWTAHWSLAGHSGTIGGLRSSGALGDFAVREVQAVRTR